MSETNSEVKERIDEQEINPEEAKEAEENGSQGADIKPEDPTSEEKSEDNQEEKAEEKPEEKKEDEDLQTKFLRLNADFQNYRRRTEKEKSDIYSYANEKIVLQILDVMDNFERAMAAAPKEDKFAEGMELILKQFQDLLTKNNVTEVEAVGKPFDPAFHNAVMTEAAGEGVESQTVTKVLQKGYLMNNKLIRPAMVCVAQ